MFEERIFVLISMFAFELRVLWQLANFSENCQARPKPVCLEFVILIFWFFLDQLAKAGVESGILTDVKVAVDLLERTVFVSEHALASVKTEVVPMELTTILRLVLLLSLLSFLENHNSASIIVMVFVVPAVLAKPTKSIVPDLLAKSLSLSFLLFILLFC